MRALLAAVLVVAAGCGTHDHARLGTRLEAPIEHTRAATVTALPAPLRSVEIALATPTAGVSPERAAQTAEGVRAALERTGLFDRVALATTPRLVPGAGAPARIDLGLLRHAVRDRANDDFALAF